MTETTTGPGTVLDGLLGIEVRAHFQSGGHADGTLVQADAVGVLLEPCEHTIVASPPGIEAAPLCVVPWSQIRLMTPAPDAKPGAA